ncbi:UNVERIFIED_CONTAM: Kinesin-like protein KIN-7D, mitochondrial [Sesamum calycinum]|uniref:Kinesin-like protein n=1 Tax=Sesamum calycinum TaxID=2727403 RepID=A0AAW2PQ52_9LAMI
MAASSSRGRSSSPFHYRKPSSPYSSTSSSSSMMNGRLMPRSCSSSTASFHGGGGGGGYASRSTTPSRNRGDYPLSQTPVSYPSAEDQLVGEPVDDAPRSGDSISVTIRFRPLSEREYQRGDEIAWYADGDKIVRNEYNPMTAYAFDRVFGPNTITEEVYEVAARPVVKAAMEGINGTVFAYGVTSSGKTHTMHGDQNSPGIIPLLNVFSIIQDTPGREFLLRVSYLEIYNEVINDLLDPTGQNLRVREDAQGTYVEGIKEEVVLSPGHALSFYCCRREEHRHVGSNNFNLFSSRSHTIFTLMIESSAHGDEYDGVIFSQLNLIDLAGSESSKTETTGLRRKEGSYINKSLLTLGTVIGKLSEGKASHVPYRDSKLTRLLQSSLSGHGHVSIIDEKSLIKKYQREISSLREELDQFKRGMLVGVNHEEIMVLRQQKLDVLRDGSLKLDGENQKDSSTSALTIPSDAYHFKHRRSSSKWNDDISQAGSTITENSRTAKPKILPISFDDVACVRLCFLVFLYDEVTLSDHMDLLVEQVKMLAGEIAFGTSTLKRLVEQSMNDPESSKTQIENLEREIQEKRKQMRVLEQRIVESGEASVTNASMVEMQQTIMKLKAQCSEKGFELEIKSADNRVLQEQLQNKCAENKELAAKIVLLEQKLASNSGDNKPPHSENFVPDECTDELRRKIQSQEIENEKLKLEHVQILERTVDYVYRIRKEASYAKELASAAAVELKNLAGEVTKLSLQNAKLEKTTNRRGRISGRGNDPSVMVNDDFDSWDLDPDDLKMELQARKQREAGLWLFLEDEYRKKGSIVQEGKVSGRQDEDTDQISDLKVDDIDCKDPILQDRQDQDNSTPTSAVPKEEPLVVRLKARMQEMKEKELRDLSYPYVYLLVIFLKWQVFGSLATILCVDCWVWVVEDLVWVTDLLLSILGINVAIKKN